MTFVPTKPRGIGAWLRHRSFTIAWILWGAAFAAIEGRAIYMRSQRRGTLSEHVWTATRVPVVWWLLFGFMVWLSGHFLLRARLRRWLGRF